MIRADGCTWRRNDDGQLAILVVGLAGIVMMLLVVVVYASAAFLARRDLVSTVDAVAVAAAQRIDLATFYAEGADDAIPLDQRAVDDIRAEFSADGVVLDEVTVRADGVSVYVAAHRELDLPLGDFFNVGPIVVRAHAVARSPLR